MPSRSRADSIATADSSPFQIIHANCRAMRAYLLLACLTASTVAQGQTADPRLRAILTGSVGKTVRLQVDSGRSLLTGAIERVRGDTVILVSNSGIAQSATLPRVARVDIREALSADARLRRTRLAAVAGVLIGAAIGYAIAVPQVRRAEQRDDWYARKYYLFDPLVGAVAGGAIGAASGNAWPNRWVSRYP